MLNLKKKKPRAETKHMQTINEWMELMMNENKAKKEGIIERKKKISVSMEEEYSDEKEVQEEDPNWKELDYFSYIAI